MTAVPHSPDRQLLLSFLRCPETGEPLSGWDGIRPDGALVSSAGRTYPVVDGIPNLLPDDLRLESSPPNVEIAEKQNEMAARDAQVQSYDEMLGLRLFTSLEIPLTLYYLRPEPTHWMLEAGCGTGRMTPVFVDRVRALVCVDFSRESIQVARQKLTHGQRARTLFLQADLSRLPLASDAFDRVGSFGVYEHIPTPQARDAALEHLARTLKPREAGGRLALSAYRWGPPQSLFSQREGHHEGGIYFVRLTGAELRDQVAAHLDVGGSTEALLYYHLIWGRRSTPPHPIARRGGE